MNNEEIFICYLIALFGVAGLVIGITINANFYTDVYNKAIILCVKQPQDCKDHFDYLKLQENQK